MWFEPRGLLPRFIAALLLIAVVGGAVAAVYAKHRARSLYKDLRQLQGERDALLEERGRLRLEEGAWGALTKIERRARDELQMRIPDRSEMVVVR